MNHLAIDRGARQQIRSLFDHSSPTALPSVRQPPRTARALEILGARWEESRRLSESARRAQLEELDRFVGVAQDVDVELSSFLGDPQ
ncbi:hypothetical protein HMPREF3056_01055 [Corynebacterium sp. HMSC056F09]|uniref:hypothetical protein n=1 Tax=Corynebacterium sp. HMSC056F09 TaxID=1739548 RepID=UPI0008A4558F|nr:hypothetical protein [Corynebacterium sp. HMSC056F09]OFO21886.1 hypothetical protein HMPREF3056_01055 [Corynebacterium sp. HMSC056F09]